MTKTETEYAVTATDHAGELRTIRTRCEDAAEATAAFWRERRGYAVTVTTRTVSE